jgi:glycosyltransferase involved in cell wall biosynthesis
MSRTLSLLIDVVAASTGGGLARALELAHTLPRTAPQHEYVFVARRGIAPTLQAFAPGIRTIVPPRLARGSPARILWEHALVPAYLRGDAAPHVVFSPFNVAPAWWTSPRVRTVVLVSNLAPYAPELRAMYRDLKGAARLEVLRRLTDRSLARADHVFVLSSQAFSLIDHKLLEGKTELLPIAPPATEAVVPDPGPVPQGPFFLITTDLMRYKGIELVLEALATLRPTERPLVLVAGRPLESGYVRTLERLRAGYGLEDRLRFLGPLEHGALLALTRNAVAAIVPSRFENGARAAIEPMSLGVPVIVGRIPGLTEACGDAAAYFRLEEPKELAAAMRRIVDDPAYRTERADAGRGRMQAIAPDSTAQTLIRCFEGLAL